MATFELPRAGAGSVATGRGRRAGRIPGAGDVPRIGVPGDPGLRVPDLAGAGSGLEVAGQAVSEIGAAFQERLAAAQDRLDRRRESIERIRAGREFNEFGNSTFTEFESTRDFSRQADAEAFGKALDAKQAELLEAHQGSEESKLQLLERLEPIASSWIDRGAVSAVKAQDALVKQQFDEVLNGLAAEARLDPSRAQELIQNGMAELRAEQDSLRPGQEIAFERALNSRVYGAVIEHSLGAGDFDDARNLLQDPVVQNALGEEDQRAFFNRIDAGLKALREPEKLVEIFDADSPTQTRLVPQSQAIGQPGKPRTPMISITDQGESAMAKELGKLDAQRVTDLEENAQTAFRTLAEVDRMRTAVESGKFSTGVFSDARLFLARLADFVGASEETRSIIGDAKIGETLDAATNRLGVEAAQKLGRITNMSLQFVRDSLPNLARTPDGNLILLEVMDRTSKREIQLASMADDFIQRHGTLRPADGRSYFQAVRDLEETDPVINEELRQRIIEGSRVGADAPSFSERLSSLRSSRPPEGFVVPEGHDFVRMQDGKAVIRNRAGQEFIQETAPTAPTEPEKAPRGRKRGR